MAGAMLPCFEPGKWGWGYGRGYGCSADRYYAEESLRRDLQLLEERYRRHLYEIERYHPYGCNEWYATRDFAERCYREDKDNIIRRYDTYNRDYYRDYYAPKYYIAADWGLGQPYTYTYSYLNSITGETMPIENKKYIIIGSKGAATHPTQHSTLASAETEANRLAKANPGEEFTIHSTVKSYKVEEKPVTVKTYV